MVEYDEHNEEKEEDDNDELYEHLRLEVDEGQSPVRIDKYVRNQVSHLSRNKVQKASEADCLLVNDEPVKSSYKIKPNDTITIVLPHPRRKYEMIPEQMDLTIIYEDDTLLVVNKPAGLVVHPGAGNWTGTLAHGLAWHLKDQLEKEDLDPMRPGIVHRIDKWTSGLLVVAKTEHAVSHLSNQFYKKSVDRVYEALVWGQFEEDAGTINENIARNKRDRRVFQVYKDEAIGKNAITHYKVIEDLGYVSRIECRLETGRTHQIRVHMTYLNHPIFADKDYGGHQIVKGTVFTKYKQFVTNCFKICGRQALHAKTLGFTHPVSGKRLSFTSELPAHMSDVIEKWRKYATQLKR